MLINSTKEVSRLRKRINRLLRKGMSNIYLKGTIKKTAVLKNYIF